MAEVRRIAYVDELRRLGRLRDVVYFEVHGRRGDAVEAVPELYEGTDVTQLAEGGRLSTRFRTVLRAPDGVYVVDLAVVFEFDEPVQFDPSAVREFAATVAFPVAHPFIREALRDMASRLGLKRPMLQLLPPEGINLDEPASEEATTSS